MTCHCPRLNNFLVWTFRFGAIDAKLASKHSFPSLNFAAVAGPTHDQHPPFSWDQVPYNRPYFMPINTFYFHPFNQKWVLNSLNSSNFDEKISCSFFNEYRKPVYHQLDKCYIIVLSRLRKLCVCGEGIAIVK